jgi:hypothetical protein
VVVRVSECDAVKERGARTFGDGRRRVAGLVGDLDVLVGEEEVAVLDEDGDEADDVAHVGDDHPDVLIARAEQDGSEHDRQVGAVHLVGGLVLHHELQVAHQHRQHLEVGAREHGQQAEQYAPPLLLIILL